MASAGTPSLIACSRMADDLVVGGVVVVPGHQQVADPPLLVQQHRAVRRDRPAPASASRRSARPRTRSPPAAPAPRRIVERQPVCRPRHPHVGPDDEQQRHRHDCRRGAHSPVDPTPPAAPPRPRCRLERHRRSIGPDHELGFPRHHTLVLHRSGVARTDGRGEDPPAAPGFWRCSHVGVARVARRLSGGRVLALRSRCGGAAPTPVAGSRYYLGGTGRRPRRRRRGPLKRTWPVHSAGEQEAR